MSQDGTLTPAAAIRLQRKHLRLEEGLQHTIEPHEAFSRSPLEALALLRWQAHLPWLIVLHLRLRQGNLNHPAGCDQLGLWVARESWNSSTVASDSDPASVSESMAAICRDAADTQQPSRGDCVRRRLTQSGYGSTPVQPASAKPLDFKTSVIQNEAY